MGDDYYMSLGNKILTTYIVLINIIAFLLMGIDKRRAIRHKWRIPEKTLFLSAILLGSVGANLGMQVFRHKTKHARFVIGMPVILIIQVLISICLLFFE